MTAPQSARESAAPGRLARAGAALVRWGGGLGVPTVAALYLLSALACCLLAATGRASFVDLHVYRLGGQTVLHGGNICQAQFGRHLPFTYPPFAVTALVPLALLPFLATAAMLTAASVAALPMVLYLALRLPPGPSWLGRAGAGRLALAAAAAAIWLEPVRSELHFGQIDLLLAAAILCDLALPSTARYKGALIGIAAGIKLTPAIFIVYLLITRRYRAAATAAATLRHRAQASEGSLRECGGPGQGSSRPKADGTIRPSSAPRLAKRAIGACQKWQGGIASALIHAPR